MALILDFLTAFWLVATRMAPWLLLGFMMAGLLSVYISPRWLERHLGGNGMGPVWKASLFGIPLPLCSCGVIPVGAGLKRQGASPGATAAFMLSTPQASINAIAVTGAMLGPVFAVYRPISALISGVVGGALVQAAMGGRTTAIEQAAAVPMPRARERLQEAFRYGFLTMPREIGKPLVIGLFLAALITALVPAGALSGLLGGGFVPIIGMMIVSIPLYVCSTGSVPLAAGFIHAGVSPGAAMAFLIAGATTNVAMVAAVIKILGRRAAVIYVSTIAMSAVGGGLLLDMVFSRFDLHVAVLHAAHGHTSIGWLDHLWAVLLIANLGWVFRPRRGASKGRAEVPKKQLPDAGPEAAAAAPFAVGQGESLSCCCCRRASSGSASDG